ncbi:MAG: hypothetical protein ACE15F_05815 [bacterium]
MLVVIMPSLVLWRMVETIGSFSISCVYIMNPGPGGREEALGATGGIPVPVQPPLFLREWCEIALGENFDNEIG